MAKLGGSAVDAMVASVFCLGVQGSHSSGIGGGTFMLIYDTYVFHCSKSFLKYVKYA